MDFKRFLNYSGIVFIFVCLFGAGFYFGYKAGILKGREGISMQNQMSRNSIDVEEVEAKNVDGVMFIKLGEQPICPESHPIKGKIDNDTRFYYTKENKTFDRVKPQLCFATEEFAKNIGFSKRF